MFKCYLLFQYKRNSIKSIPGPINLCGTTCISAHKISNCKMKINIKELLWFKVPW